MAEKVLSKPAIYTIFAVALGAAVFVMYLGGVFAQPDMTLANNVKETATTGHTEDHSAAYKEIENKIAASPDSIELVLQYAHLLQDTGIFEKAIEQYKKYLVKVPKNEEAIIDMGVCYFNLENIVKADSLVRAALKINPNNPTGNFNMGVITLNQGKKEESRAWFEKVIAVAPNSDQAEVAKEILQSH